MANKKNKLRSMHLALQTPEQSENPPYLDCDAKDWT